MEKDLAKIKNILKSLIPGLVKDYDIKTVEVFGSYSRNEQTSKSDIDLLVSFSNTPSLLKFIALENYLAKQLNAKVDLVLKNSLKPRLRERILEESIQI